MLTVQRRWIGRNWRGFDGHEEKMRKKGRWRAVGRVSGESSGQKTRIADWTFPCLCYVWYALRGDNPRDRVNSRPLQSPV